MSDLTPKEQKEISQAWYDFMQKTIRLDTVTLDTDRIDTDKHVSDQKPRGWYWFWGIYCLRMKVEEFLIFDFETVQNKLPDGHWLKKIDVDFIGKKTTDSKQTEATDGTQKETTDDVKKEYETLKKETSFNDLCAVLTKYKNSKEIMTINFFEFRFKNKVDFSNFIFPIETNFNNAKFLKDTLFTDAIFLETADFENAKFHEEPVTHKETAKFKNTIFNKVANFNKAIFNAYANFKEATFKGRTIFQQAEFKYHAPRFYGATFNNELILNRIELPESGKFTRGKVNDNYQKTIEENKDNYEEYQKTIEENKSAYETLIFLMGEQNKHHDKHRFFREEMRWRQLGNKLTRERRIADAPNKASACHSIWWKIKKWQIKRWQIKNRLEQKPLKEDLLKKTNKRYTIWQRFENNFTIAFFWFYDKVADYGNGIGRSFTWWLCHIAGGIGALMVMVLFSLLWECWQGKWEFTKDMFCSIPVSFANANPLAFIDFKDGGLMYCHDKLKSLSPFSFGMIKTVQIIVGIPLLFIFLTTLRVRFRLGGKNANTTINATITPTKK